VIREAVIRPGAPLQQLAGDCGLKLEKYSRIADIFTGILRENVGRKTRPVSPGEKFSSSR
jgi:hypothetical protein